MTVHEVTEESAAAPVRTPIRAVIDGNEAAATVAHLASEVIAIYPITPASTMGELADEWSAKGRANLWGAVPEVVEMQSEAGAAGTLHGAITRGALGTTFTASQGLLLMLPNMFKIAGELSPTVIHVAARTLATHALSIFGDHSDVMAARSTGFAMLCSSSVQEAGDRAAVAHAATLETRVPFLHFFDGFRTSNELNTVEAIDADTLRLLIGEQRLSEHRNRGLDPDRPVLRGSAQNPDVFFQAREACSPFHARVPEVVQQTMDQLASTTGRQYHLVDYHGAIDAERVVVLMGSGVGAVREAVDALCAGGERVGVAVVRLYRPFPTQALLAALPPSTRTLIVLDRTKEPGAPVEPLHLDVLAALWHSPSTTWADGRTPQVIGGRYGLSSKEFTPAMAKAVFDEASKESPSNAFTIGIVDDVSHTSLSYDPSFRTDAARVRAVLYGLGADGTVGANKNTAKIVGKNTDLHVQAYFVYDSKKSGSMTISHLRFDPDPIQSTYLIDQATFVGVHQWNFLERMDVLEVAATEVYSNTGGQSSKATPRGAVAKFAAGGKGTSKKDLGLEAMSYGDVYVAHVALGGSDVQTVKALLEAEAWPGVSLVIAYSTCIAHGIDMSKSMTQQKVAVHSGHWPLYRYQPGDGSDLQPFQLDSAAPTVPYRDFAMSEARFAMLDRSDPERSAMLLALAQDDVNARWRYYRQLAGLERSAPVHAPPAAPNDATDSE